MPPVRAYPLFDTYTKGSSIPWTATRTLWTAFLRDAVDNGSVPVYSARSTPASHPNQELTREETTASSTSVTLTVHNIYCDVGHTQLYYVPTNLHHTCLTQPPVFTEDAHGYQALLTTAVLYTTKPAAAAAVLQLADMNWDNPNALGLLQKALQHASELSPQLRRAVVLFYSLPMPKFSLRAFFQQLHGAVDAA